MPGSRKPLTVIPGLTKSVAHHVFGKRIVSEDLRRKIAYGPIVFVEYVPESLFLPIPEPEEPIIAFNSCIQIARV